MLQLLPSTCVLCGDKSGQITNICESCRQALPWVTGTYNRIYALCRYEEPMDRLITALKFKHQLIYARLLGELLAERLQCDYTQEKLPEYVIPMPLHAQRLRERGFNQAVELARPIVKKLKIPMDLQICQRIRATEMQTSLPAALRHSNVKKAFQVSSHLKAKHVAILDDVVTTGHTVMELSHVLQTAGVERIDIWCCARTFSPAHLMT